MEDDAVLETRFMFQPRGDGTRWFFRMATPDGLKGAISPHTGRKYGGEIKRTLGTRDVVQARRNRDVLLGEIRLEEIKASDTRDDSISSALGLSPHYRSVSDEERDVLGAVLVNEAEAIGRKKGAEYAGRWYDAATGQKTPLTMVYERYLAGRVGALSQSTLNNLRTAIREFLEYAGNEVMIEDVDRRMVAGFVDEHLPKQTSSRAPDGPGPATVRKKVTLLRPIWQWAMDRGLIDFVHTTPWDRQAPTEKQVRKAAKRRRMFEPEEVRAILKAAPVGTPMGE